MISSEALPSALFGEKDALSEQTRQEILALNGRRPVRFLWEVFFAWAVIGACIWWASAAQNIWVSALVVFIIATRQNILGLLIHEQAHCLAFKAGRGDWLANLVAGYPLLVLTVEDYAQVHLAHHKYYFTQRDPDFLRKSGLEWTFPMQRSQLLKLFLTDLFALNLWKNMKGKRVIQKADVFKRRNPAPMWLRVGFYVAAATALTAVQGWTVFLLYWALPLVTVFQVIVRWGAICEHKYNLPDAGVAESSPVIILHWWEKLLLPNLNFTLHPYHHYFPGVAFVRLPKIHAIFEREGLVNGENIFRGYWPYLRYLLTP